MAGMLVVTQFLVPVFMFGIIIMGWEPSLCVKPLPIVVAIVQGVVGTIVHFFADWTCHVGGWVGACLPVFDTLLRENDKTTKMRSDITVEVTQARPKSWIPRLMVSHIGPHIPSNLGPLVYRALLQHILANDTLWRS